MRARNRDRESREIQALTAYWDDVVRLAPTTPVPPAATPSDLTSLVRHLHSAEDADQHRPPYEDRLLQRLLDTYQETTTMSAPALAPAHAPWLPKRRHDLTVPPPTQVGADPSMGIPWVAVLVSAALVLLALAVAVGQFGWGRGNDGSGPGGPAIFAPGTPSPEADTTDETLVEIPLPADVIPPGELGTAGLGDITVPVGTFGYPTEKLVDPRGVMACYVLEGTLTVVSDGGLQVIHADGDGVVEEVQPGTEITLEPGDTLITRHSPGEAWTNEGPRAARLITSALWPGGYLESNIEPNGWIRQGADATAAESIAQPEAPTVIRLRRVAVPADAVLVPPADALAFLVWPEDRGSIGRASDGSVIIVGGQATTAFIMTIELIEDAATPTP